MKYHFIIALFGFLLGMVSGSIVTYNQIESKYQQDISDFTIFNNNQIEVLFKSELETCNHKWSNSCGLGLTRIDGITYYTIDTKDMNDKGIKLYLDGESK